MKHLDLFSGIGGFALAASWVWGEEHEIHSFVEIEPFCQKVLKKHWPNAPIHDDIRTYEHDGTEIDLITAGFPCQDISVCGDGDGLEGERSGLFYECIPQVQRIKPRWVILENVAALLVRGIDEVLRSLAKIGYNAQWHGIPATYIGANHRRDRIWVIANANSECVESMDVQKSLCANTKKSRRWELTRTINACIPADDYRRCRGSYDGVSVEMDRLKALGNAIVPQVVVPIMEAIKSL
jgi:DNA (cytosine-5)-methyltransferase 1